MTWKFGRNRLIASKIRASWLCDRCHSEGEYRSRGLCVSCGQMKQKQEKPVGFYSERYRSLEDRGITQAEYDALVEKCKGACCICGEVPIPEPVAASSNGRTRATTRRSLYIDHCHNSGKVRGLLCKKCNFGLGHFRDDQNLLEKAIKYLQENG